VTTSLGEWGRRHWGEGGKEFDWWCTEAPGAFSARVPVHRSLRDEIVAIAGQDVYDLLASYLESRTAQRGRGASLLAHPTVRKRAASPIAESRAL
jgi:hypothetical protein